MAGLLILGHSFGNGDEDLNGEKADTILVVGDEMLEKGNHLVNDYLGRHLFDKFGEVGSSLAADHRCFIVHQQAKLLAKLLL